MGPHHYHIDDEAIVVDGVGVVLVGCNAGEDCEKPTPAYDLVRVRRVWQRDVG